MIHWLYDIMRKKWYIIISKITVILDIPLFLLSLNFLLSLYSFVFIYLFIHLLTYLCLSIFISIYLPNYTYIYPSFYLMYSLYWVQKHIFHKFCPYDKLYDNHNRNLNFIHIISKHYSYSYMISLHCHYNPSTHLHSWISKRSVFVWCEMT